MKTVGVQSAAILVLLTLYSVNTVLSLTCYVCSYSGNGTDTYSCLNPSASTPTVVCDAATYAGCGKNTFTASAGNTAPSTADRSCAISGTGCSLIINAGGTTRNCNCATDLCNGETTSSSSSSTRNSTFNSAISLQRQMFYPMSLMTAGAAVFTGRLRL